MPPSILKTETLPIASDSDIILVRQAIRLRIVEIGLGLVDQTKAITAASELARNTLIYGGGGSARIELLQDGARKGIRMSFEDQGPGIADVELALRDGYTSGHGLGLGLGGAKRLVSEFELESRPGQGTRVTITKWK